MNSQKKPITVCFIAPKAYPLFNPSVEEVFGGAEVDLYYLATELAQDSDYRVSFIVADYGQQKVEQRGGVKVIKSLDFKQNSLTGAVKIWRALNKADADIYMIKTVSPGMFLLAFYCRCKSRHFIYRTAHCDECDGTYLSRYHFAGKLYKWALKKADVVFTQNDTDRNNLKKTTGIDAVTVPNGHRLEPLQEVKRDIILWVARSAEFKRPELFIKLAKQFPQAKFVMICQRATGDKNYERLVKQAEGIDNLEFIQRVPFAEIDNYFRRAKVFVNTSEAEGFPNTFIQACKAGTAIVSLNVNPDGFLDKYKCGICCDDNFDRLVSSLKSVVQNQSFVEMGKNARKYVEQTHNVADIVRQYKTIINTLTNKKHK